MTTDIKNVIGNNMMQKAIINKSTYILSLDPGLGKHFGYAVVNDTETIYDTRIKYGVFTDVPDKMNIYLGYGLQHFFRSQIYPLFEEFKIRSIVAERFMYRPGAGKGCSGEYINMILGSIFFGTILAPVLITPASHKNWWRGVHEDSDYQKFVDTIKDPHARDAVKIALYYKENKNKNKILKILKI